MFRVWVPLGVSAMGKLAPASLMSTKRISCYKKWRHFDWPLRELDIFENLKKLAKS
jgi:hypothetical protein